MRNIDYIVKVLVKKYGYDEEVVRVILHAYWKDVSDKLASFEHESIFLRHIGTISFSYFLLRKKLPGYLDKVRREKGSKRKEFLRRLLKHRDKHSKRFYEFIKRGAEKFRQDRGGDMDGGEV